MSSAWSLALRSGSKPIAQVLVFGLVALGAGISTGSSTATGIAVILTLTLSVFVIHSAWRIAGGLASFARVVPQEPDESVSGGVAQLSWPSLDLAVQANVAVLGDPSLQADVAGEAMIAPTTEARSLAQKALDALGVESRSSQTIAACGLDDA